ncbi:hypothetical protein A2715_03525 [Candidatus Woesebacteria bacterium RIFCSPHIGHO2_01_FULL_39_32]|uniref:Plasmid stabilization protein n=1 Tax=Candidatus Woesebacteria bacterium RIFCSPLOWO2_01_FULL_39_25 TaxID=1802521 RepID=A0A1F8BKQ0_9BACT|nr:MAG: hypothetical protein A2124_04830 [Candidatus Woesebacteria bacterium GWB1_37_5]OGM24810.1 MAG: hypothetical protein A2715_03525 [Candidatus Woesebacteria bacterium RIFCSPHIGHO2_01_FULL_39_32]OGM37131.1 MAG: hypothetical protein A3F01_05465 [Candidatus Woesebacteria bacterium RIFCSPHIGHO2_12_FULL_38_11]OGM64636.1 MAG: hypothetical protein A2893_06440 [Candidatus Woesebacteria bacterium RIFCSPLOWO2_01_FULL_39_25]
MYEVYFSRTFDRNLKKIVKNNPKLKIKLRHQIELLSTNPKHPSLRLHKLSGENNWSISITSDIRIIFTIEENRILFNRIGSHDEVY